MRGEETNREEGGRRNGVAAKQKANFWMRSVDLRVLCGSCLVALPNLQNIKGVTGMKPSPHGANNVTVFAVKTNKQKNLRKKRWREVS